LLCRLGDMNEGDDGEGKDEAEIANGGNHGSDLGVPSGFEGRESSSK
jgi:hypothetical protein